MIIFPDELGDLYSEDPKHTVIVRLAIFNCNEISTVETVSPKTHKNRTIFMRVTSSTPHNN